MWPTHGIYHRRLTPNALGWRMRIAALAGGVGAAKLLAGLIHVIDPADMTVIGNTGDDATFHGLHVSPDLDIVMYTLGGIVDTTTGWGIRGDTTVALDAMKALGAEAWFRLGDRDLGTHLARTTWLREGRTLTEVTASIASALGLAVRVIPMSNDSVRTRVRVAGGIVREFQEYFVRYGHTEEVEAVDFVGAEEASPAPGVLEALREADRILICPSNPVVSIGPILAVPGIRELLTRRRDRVWAVSPIVGGRALKGPADRMMSGLRITPTASGVAGIYKKFAGNFVLDQTDAGLSNEIEALGMQTYVLDTVMHTPADSERLAKEIISL